MSVKLIVGLGNPGKDYQPHRHNVGFWFCDALANLFDSQFKQESKFFAQMAKISIAEHSVYLLKPNTYVNCSGQSVQSVVKFYQLDVDEILVVHDELDIDAGSVKIKFDGGHGGHNGLRDIIKSITASGFYRLRVGIGHPGDKTKVSNFMLHAPNKVDFQKIQNALTSGLQVIEDIVKGNFDKAMKNLHTQG